MIVYQDKYYWPSDDIRKLHIYLPNDYDRSNERYPVMYMFDGHNLYHDDMATYGKSWGLESFLDNWDKKIIIVGIECSHRGDERLYEYCPYMKRMFGKTINGIGDQTFQWIIDEIKPYIDATFRTYGHREATAIAGSSMGGIMSMYGVLKYNDVFSKAAVISSSVFLNLKHYQNSLQNRFYLDTKIYISWGELEAGKAAYGGNPEFDTREARSVYKFEKELQNNGIQTYHYFQRNGKHCEADWEKQNALYMNFLWK